MDNRPEWASFMTDTEYGIFISMIHKYFEDTGIAYTEDGSILTVDKETFGIGNIALQSLAQHCKQYPMETYAQIVNDYFDTLKKVYSYNKEFEKTADNFEKIAPRLGVRLHNSAYIEYIGKESVVSEETAPDLHMVLVFDLPDSIVNVRPEIAGTWDKNRNELFRLGIEQTRSKYPATTRLQEAHGVNFYASENEHFYTANIIFELADKPEFTGRYGTLVGIPTRHIAAVYPINDKDVFQAINVLYQTVYSIHAKEPGALSECLYWYNGGVFTKLPVGIDDEHLCFFPPENFVKVLEEIRTEGAN